MRESKYYTEKALSYPKDIDAIYQPQGLKLEIGKPYGGNVGAGKAITHSIYVRGFGVQVC